MKQSWRIKLTLMIMATVAGAIIVTWILNKTLLGTYYVNSKKEALKETYEVVESILAHYYMSDESYSASLTKSNLYVEFPNAGDTDSYSASFLESENYINTKSTKPADDREYEINRDTEKNNFLNEEDQATLEKLRTRQNLSIFIMKDGIYTYTTENQKFMFTYMELIGKYLNNKGKLGELVYSDTNGRYDMFLGFDEHLSCKYLSLVSGDLIFGDFVVIRTNMESIRESTRIANTFLLYAGLIVIAISSLVMMYIGGAAVRPIRQLAGIARSVSELNFDARYMGPNIDEIGELGQSINVMSERLEQTISDLKSANNRLQSDIDQKIQIDEMRKEFLSNVTHELKTPIALISGYAEGLKDCINDDAESREFYCDVIIDEASKMNTMVKKLLTLNQIEFGSQMIELERFDLSEMIRSVVQSVDVLLKNDRINLICNIPEHLCVWADEYMIEEVLINFLSNAIHHCENEKVIDIKTEAVENGVRVSVFNTGIPIPEEDIDKIWIKFYKVDKARTREYGGTGIGLSIVKAIMDAHNKNYGVINHSNGVEFWFELDSKCENK